MKKIRLTKEEQEIEDNAENFIPLSPRNRRRMEQALAKARKEASISLRLTAQDLWDIKRKAAEEGIPYQTFIGSILHKYATDQLIEDKVVRKFMGVLKARR